MYQSGGLLILVQGNSAQICEDSMKVVMKKVVGILILLVVAALLSCPNPAIPPVGAPGNSPTNPPANSQW